LKKTLKAFELIVSIFVSVGFIYIFYKIIGFDKLLYFFKDVSTVNILLAFLLYLLSYITRTYRWIITLHIKDFKKLFKITVYNTVFNIFLPFRTGEISFFYMLKKENVNFSESVLPFLTVRLFDGFSLLAIFIFSYLLYKDYLVFAFLFILIFPLFIFIFFKSFKFIKIKKFSEFSKEKLDVKNIFYLYILSIFTLVLKFGGFLFILPSALKLSLSELFLAASAGDLTTVLPIHGIAGIGTYEGGFAGLLLFLGVDKDTALIASVFVHIFLLLSSLLLAAVVFLINKK
jgi:hypothetical protein